jgi:cysteinyl-tRNA synthetase
MVEVLGINPGAPQWASGAANQAEGQALDKLIRNLLEQRNTARGAKDFARADEIRDALQQAGIHLEDSADSTHWSLQMAGKPSRPGAAKKSTNRPGTGGNGRRALEARAQPQSRRPQRPQSL